MKPHTPAHAQSKVRVTQSALRPRPHTRTHRHARLTSVAVSDRKDPVCPSHSESTASFALWKTVAPFELFSHDVQHFSTQHQSGETLLFDGKKSYVFIASVHADILQTLQATRGTILSADLKYPFALFVLGESLRFFISWILFEHVPHLYPDACESCWNEVNKKKNNIPEHSIQVFGIYALVFHSRWKYRFVDFLLFYSQWHVSTDIIGLVRLSERKAMKRIERRCALAIRSLWNTLNFKRRQQTVKSHPQKRSAPSHQSTAITQNTPHAAPRGS